MAIFVEGYRVNRDISPECNVKLSVYALDECSIYQGAYIDADFYINNILSNGNISSCREISLSTDTGSLLFTTQTKSDVANQIYCRYHYLNSVKRGKMILSSDENANILISNHNCNNPQIINISEALLHNYNNPALEPTEKPTDEAKAEPTITGKGLLLGRGIFSSVSRGLYPGFMIIKILINKINRYHCRSCGSYHHYSRDNIPHSQEEEA